MSSNQEPEAENPTLGAFTAPVQIQLEVGGQPYQFSSSAITFTPSGSEKVRSISGVGSFLPLGVPPIPPRPPQPKLAQLLVSPAEIPAGGSATLTVGVGPVVEGSPGVTVSLAYSAALVEGPVAVDIPAGMVSKSVKLQGRGLSGTVTVTASDGSSTQQATLTLKPIIPLPSPVPVGLVNVRLFGATGTGATDDRAAIQKAIDTATPGQTVFFPAGRYKITDTIKLYNKNGVGFLGEGSTSEIIHPQGNGLVLSNGNPLTGLVVRKLAFRGSGDGVFLFGPRGTLIEECTFYGCGHAIYDAGDGDPQSHGSTKGTQIIDCQVQGWGSVALFLNGDNVVRDTDLIQTGPKNQGSHGIYIHSGASNVLIEDVLIKDAQKYGLQVYGEQLGTQTKNITLRRVIVAGARDGGIILAHSQMGAADIEGCVIEDCTITGVSGGPGLHVKNGTGVTVKRNAISGVTNGAGICVGYLAPYEGPPVLEHPMQIGPVEISNNVVHGCSKGFWAMQSWGALFNSVKVENNDFSGNVSYDIHLEEWNGVKPHLTLAGNLGRVAGSAG